jgi:uncharacterized membrane protein YeaQ/YmgE (transglycosylase-associated protein family)
MTERSTAMAVALLPVVAQAEGGKLNLRTILLYVLIGAVIGIIARLIVPGTGGMGWVVTIVVGILGAVIGGWVAGAVFEETEGVDWIASILVAILLVWIVARAGWGTRRRAL